jgi:hypothetical protein
MPYKIKAVLNTLFSILLLVIMLVLVWSAVLAQQPVSLSALEVDLWPEYDRPSVLVIYRITLSPEVGLPADLTLRIPVAAGEPHAVAAKQPDGSLVNIEYQRVVSGDWGVVSLTASQPELQLEYYDPGITREGTTRRFEYRWPGDYTVEDMKIQVQQPLGATNLRTSPSLGEQVTDANGLSYHNANIGALSAGQEFDISVVYDKTTEGLTAAGLQVQPSAPVADIAQGWLSQLQPALPWGLLVLGVILLVGGAVWYWQSGKRGEKPSQPRRRRKPAAAAEEPAPKGHVYCHSCGKRAGPGDRFCRACGTRLRLG